MGAGTARTRHGKHFWLLVGVCATLLVLIGIVLIVGGTLQSPSRLTLTATAPANCTGSISYSVELTGAEGLANEPVAVSLNAAPFEHLRTDQNGRFSSTAPLRPEWCGQPINLTAAYAGTLFHQRVTTSTIVLVKIPTTIELFALDSIEVGQTATLRARLTATQPLANRGVTITAGDQVLQATTDNDGNAQLSYTFTILKPTPVQAHFDGDNQYLAAESTIKTVTVTAPACNDGTLVNACSTTQSYYCTTTKQLVFDCTKCGCASGLLCDSNACVTQEQKNTALITRLQQSVVLVGYANPDGSGASGSGVILAQHNGQTTILTNRHVVNDAPNVAAVKVITINKQEASADTIQIAPSGMDLAIITIAGTYGTPATTDDSTLEKGQDVVVLGSPGGLNGDILQGSVAKGIISNFETQTVYFDNTGYTYNAIQTDAAVNHGNSGGGLFLLSNGHLIGINTLGGASDLKQGINFAIDIKELQRLPATTSWPAFTATPKCQDGTAYNTCSATNTGFLCTSGTLTPSCKTCGCPSTYPYCPNSGTCFSCPAGTSPFQTASGQGFCCGAGYKGTSDGHCV